MHTTLPNLHYVRGRDLLEFKADYIAHQCNCISKGSSGLAKTIKDRYPYADQSIGRPNSGGSSKADIPGTIRVFLPPKNVPHSPTFIGMFAQYAPGPPTDTETARIRLDWFEDCLDEISNSGAVVKVAAPLQSVFHADRLHATSDSFSIAFPERIGCGLAGGNWDKYHNVLWMFASTNEHIDVTIVSNRM
jgi:O-acetyl-ADP-ribose deacetylase (regulator of RNase III)